ncbi:MAG: ATP-grasp domain-containing protein [Chloroflexota bacterium]
MKKIGLLYGMENDFPNALAAAINEKGGGEIECEEMKIGILTNPDFSQYSVIFDKVSLLVPFYRTMLKAAAHSGVKVVNNPFKTCHDDLFYAVCMAEEKGIKSPKTALLPTKRHPEGTTSDTVRNLVYPLNWDELFDYIKFPATLRTNQGNHRTSSYKVYNPREFFSTYDLTGSKVMALQESLECQQYYRAFVIGKKNIRIVEYEPNRPQHLRYGVGEPQLSAELRGQLESSALKVCEMLGFDFNSVELAIVQGEIYVMNFFNVNPNSERAILLDDTFNWLVENTADYLLELARNP